MFQSLLSVFHFIFSVDILASKAADNHYHVPLMIVWCYHFIEGHHEIANQMWLEHIQFQKDIAFKYITQTAIRKQDVMLAKKLVDLLESSSVSEEALAMAHSDLLDVYAATEQFEEGAKVIDMLNHQKKLHLVQKASLKRIRRGLEAAGKLFPYKIED